jgi:hypothetical protein
VGHRSVPDGVETAVAVEQGSEFLDRALERFRADRHKRNALVRAK